MRTLQITEEELKVLQLCLDVSYDHYDCECDEEEEVEVFKTLYEKVYNVQ